MSESVSYTQRHEQLGIGNRARQLLAPLASLALVVNGAHIQPEDLPLEVTGQTTVHHPETHATQTVPLTKNVVLGKDGHELSQTEIQQAIKLDAGDETSPNFERAKAAILEIIDPSQRVSVDYSVDGKLIIRTGDFATYDSLQPKDSQKAEMRLSIDGEFIHATGSQTYEVSYPGYDTIETTHGYEPFLIHVAALDEATDPKRPLPLRWLPPTTRPRKRRPTPEEQPEPETLIEPEITSPEVDTPPIASEPEPVTQPQPQPRTPRPTRTVTPPAASEPRPRRTPQPYRGGAGGPYTGRTPADLPRLDPELPKFEFDDLGRHLDGRDTDSFLDILRDVLDSVRMDIDWPELARKVRIPVGILVLAAGALLLRNCDASTDYVCKLPDQSGPTNLDKRHGEWLPRFTTAACPEPKGYELSIQFDGFNDGYGLGSIDKDGTVAPGIINIPAEIVPDQVVRLAAAEQVRQTSSDIVEKVDQGREAIAQKTKKRHNWFNVR